MVRNKISAIIKSLILCFLSFNYSCDSENKNREYIHLDGVYTCEESSPHSGYKKYIVEIDRVYSQVNTYIISNFHNQGDADFLFSTYRNDSLIIENQVINGLFINGKATVSKSLDEIEFFYTTNDGRLELDYYALFSR